MDKSSKAELDKTYLIFPHDLLQTPGTFEIIAFVGFFVISQ